MSQQINSYSDEWQKRARYYRNKALELMCLIRKDKYQCAVPNGDSCIPSKHGYCPEVIKPVDSCLEDTSYE